MDLVGTCPMHEWNEWLAEGDCAGTPETGTDHYWRTRSPMAAKIKPGDRFYIVAHGRLRGYAPVVRVDHHDGAWDIVRRGQAVACTIQRRIPGFRGLRARWWGRDRERPFPDWRET